MFGKPKKRPASARRRAEADEEDDPEVRALMAQIHEMAAQVYENQQLIEELEAEGAARMAYYGSGRRKRGGVESSNTLMRANASCARVL